MRKAHFPIYLYFIFSAAISFAQSKSIEKFSHKSFSLEVSADAEQNILLSVKDPTLKSTSHFMIPDPSRFVLDIKGSDYVINKVFTVEHPLLKKVRMGSHPGKNRIVLDLKSKKVPEVKVEQKNNNRTDLLFTIFHDSHKSLTPDSQTSSLREFINLSEKETSTGNSAKLEQDTPSSEPSPTPTPARDPSPNPSPSPSPSPSQTPTPVATSTPTPPLPSPAAAVESQDREQATEKVSEESTLQEETPPDSDVQRLKGIVFKKEEPAAVEFQLTQKARFTFFKRSLKEYKLTLHDCLATEEHLLLPYFPPHTFPGVTFVQAKKEAGSLVVTLQTEHGVRLSPRLAGQSVIIEVEQTGAL